MHFDRRYLFNQQLFKAIPILSGTFDEILYMLLHASSKMDVLQSDRPVSESAALVSTVKFKDREGSKR
jgi:hypothetical protein